MDFKIARNNNKGFGCCRGPIHKPGHIDEIVLRGFQNEQDAIKRGFTKISQFTLGGFVNFLIDGQYQIYMNGPFATAQEAIDSGNKNGDYIATLEIKDDAFLPQVPVLAVVP